VTTATMSIRRNQQLIRPETKLKLGPVSSGVVAVAVISVLSLLYLNQITKTSVFGYQVTELARSEQKLSASKQELEVEAARMQSTQSVSSSHVVSTMVPEGPVSYAR
jgi:hypothetical protein